MATRARITSWFKNIVVAATIFVIEIDPWKSKVLHAPAQIGFSREKFQETIRIASSLKAIHPINKLINFNKWGCSEVAQVWSTPSIDSRKTTHRTKALEAARCRAFQQGLKRHTSTKEPARTPTGPFILMFLHFHQPLLVLCITLTISKQVDYSHSRPRSKRNFGCPQARENGFQRPGFHRRNGRLHSPTKTM